MTRLLKGERKWVSISSDYRTVIARGETLEALVKKLKKKGNPPGYIMIAAPDFSTYIGS